MNQIVANFSRRAASYDLYSSVQQTVAQRLVERFKKWSLKLSDERVLEIGCGTGHLTNLLVDTLPDHSLLVTDVSRPMINRCRESFIPKSNVLDRLEFIVADADRFNSKEQFSLIASSFAFQWLIDPRKTIKQLSSMLCPEGSLVFALPIEGSFSQWKASCQKLAVPYTANSLPAENDFAWLLDDPELAFQHQEEEIVATYPSALMFFRTLKGLGANTQIDGAAMSSSDLRKLINNWPDCQGGPVEITYKVLYGCVTKIGSQPSTNYRRGAAMLRPQRNGNLIDQEPAIDYRRGEALPRPQRNDCLVDQEPAIDYRRGAAMLCPQRNEGNGS